MKRTALGIVACVGALVLALPSVTTTYAARPGDGELIAALTEQVAHISSLSVNAHDDAVAVTTQQFGDFPRVGTDYIVMSTGIADEVLGGEPEEFISTDLGRSGGADGNDLTQLSIGLVPPPTATCFAFDFQFLTEEYPEYVGSMFNDIFTAELNESLFLMEEDQVVTPNNFAYDSEANMISVNTVFGLHEVPGTRMDGTTERLVAVSPVETDMATGEMKLILSVQDIGDSIFDSAVLIDNLRWLYGTNCARAVSDTTDSDGDGLSDNWEENGIDYDGDGKAEVNLPAMGADPLHADIFMEIDWMVQPQNCFLFICWGGRSFAPSADALRDVTQAFANAPYENPDGSSGINLHIDAGGLSPAPLGDTATGGQVPWQRDLGSIDGSGYDWSEFEAIKVGNFGPGGDGFRRDAFHYVLYADSYAGSGSSGLSRGIPAADLMVTDGDESWGPDGFSRIQERGTLMHELGHNLSLQHGGPDETTLQNDPSYESIMNYAYQLIGLPPDQRPDYSVGPPYNDWAHIRFDGGSIGDLGDVAPVTVTEADHELTAEIAREQGWEAVAGDGTVGFI